MGRIIHVELTAADVTRASDFYAAAFGWETEKSPYAADYLLADTGAGAGVDGAIMSREYKEQAVIIWLQVDDLDRTLSQVRQAGGTVDGEPHEIPGQGRVAYVRDPDDTCLGLRQPAPAPDL